jgi:aryl-alcohol dehydrogenase-like predicted oxidoreductase
MDFTTLGRTGLKVSVMGLGAGGHSRLGLAQGQSESAAIRVIEAAVALGINYIDTAEAYGTEGVVGQALTSIGREKVIISTKKRLPASPRLTRPELVQGLEDSLKRLNTEYVDVYNLHGLKLEDYDYAVTELLPAMQKAREQGKIRFIGVTEAFITDPAHAMLERALQDDYWQVVMVGFNLLNQTARQTVFPITQAKGIGVQLMFAVRKALKNFETLKEALAELAQSGQIDLGQFDREHPLDFLLADGKASSLTDAAYRFCRYEPGIEVVLVGTGNVEHLKENAASLLKPPLPAEDVARLKELFAKVNNFTGN